MKQLRFEIHRTEITPVTVEADSVAAGIELVKAGQCDVADSSYWQERLVFLDEEK